ITALCGDRRTSEFGLFAKTENRSWRPDRLLRASPPRDAVGDRPAPAADDAVAVAFRLDGEGRVRLADRDRLDRRRADRAGDEQLGRAGCRRAGWHRDADRGGETALSPEPPNDPPRPLEGGGSWGFPHAYRYSRARASTSRSVA